MAKNNIGFCLLCRAERELQRSHAIPNAYIKPILNASNGSAICFSSDNEKNHYSNDSFKERALCRCCESKLNSSYENQVLDFLKGRIGKSTDYDGYILWSDFDMDILRSFFASIYWRMANWKHQAFYEITISEKTNDCIREILLRGGVVSSKLIGVRCSKFIDSYKKLDDFKQLLSLPFFVKNGGRDVLCFSFFGLMIEMVIGGHRYKYGLQQGVLSDGKKSLLVPKKNFFDVPEYLDLALIAKAKEEYGHTVIKSDRVEASSNMKLDQPLP